MINAQMRFYDYFTLGEPNEYGQPVISDEPKGTIKMSINIASQTTQDNINYKDCRYIGLTHAPVNDSYIIQYNEEKLKVLYVNPLGRLTQVYLTNI